MQDWYAQEENEHRYYEEMIMSGLIAENTATELDPCPAGMHVGICYQVIDVGTHYSERYKKSSHEIVVTWEFPELKMTDGRPFALSKRYTLSFAENANLRKDLENWRGRPFVGDEALRFDVTRIIGQAGFLNVIHEPRKQGNGLRASITSINPVPANVPRPQPVNPPTVFILAEFDQAIYDSLPNWIKETIAASKEFQTRGNPIHTPAHGIPQDFDDEIPF